MFTDKDFPANDDAIGKVKNPPEGKIEFLRPHEFMDKVKLYDDGIEPADIVQGCLGDCYLLASLCALAEFPKRIKEMIKDCGNGKYEISYYYQGKRTTLVVDDLIPCANGKPCFSHNHGNELWVMLIEKAYAKMFGSYAKLEGGMAYLSLTDLTGMPVKRLLTRKFKKNNLFNKITKYDKSDYCMVSNIPKKPESFTEEYGLISEHAYALIGTYKVGRSKLVKLRNPWGKSDWKGKWGREDPNWTDKIKEKVEYDENDLGIFYMEIEDFMKHYEDVVTLFYKEKWDEFGSLDIQMTEKQMVIPFETKGESIFQISQIRTNPAIGYKMWVIDDNDRMIGGLSDKCFYTSVSQRGKKLKFDSGEKYRLIIELHKKFVKDCPIDLVLSCRGTDPVKFGDIISLKEEDKIPYVKVTEKHPERPCTGCGRPLPKKGFAKTQTGEYHKRCLTCSACKEHITEKYGVKDDQLLCPKCYKAKE